jgi:hypothetical protein
MRVPFDSFRGWIPVILHAVERAFRIGAMATCRWPRITAIFIAAVSLISMQALAEEQTGAHRLRDIPGPNPCGSWSPLCLGHQK